MNPLADLSQKEMKVRDFVWLENQRPLKASDVFLWQSNWLEELNIKAREKKAQFLQEAGEE
mgnify:CR=1 FL=1